MGRAPREKQTSDGVVGVVRKPHQQGADGHQVGQGEPKFFAVNVDSGLEGPKGLCMINVVRKGIYGKHLLAQIMDYSSEPL